MKFKNKNIYVDNNNTKLIIRLTFVTNKNNNNNNRNNNKQQQTTTMAAKKQINMKFLENAWTIDEVKEEEVLRFYVQNERSNWILHATLTSIVYKLSMKIKEKKLKEVFVINAKTDNLVATLKHFQPTSKSIRLSQQDGPEIADSVKSFLQNVQYKPSMFITNYSNQQLEQKRRRGNDDDHEEEEEDKDEEEEQEKAKKSKKQFLFIANKLEKLAQKESKEEKEEPLKLIEPSRKFHGSMNNNFVF